MNRDYKNILIAKLKHHGDLLTTTPLISAVKKAWPGARLSYLVNPGSEDLVRYHPDVFEVLTVPRQGGLGPQIGLIRMLRSRNFDLVLELSGGDRGAFLSWISGAPVRVGYKPKKNRIMLDRRIFFTHQVTTVVESVHTVEYHLDALRVLGVEPGRPALSLKWPTEAEDHIHTLLSQGDVDPDAPYAVVHPSSRWMFKAWRPEGNAEVLDYLMDRGLPVVVTAAPEDKEMDFVGKMLAGARHAPLNLAGRLNLAELAALIGQAGLFFGVDSLPMHMAAATNVPAVVLFGPSGEHMWGPWGEGHRVVAKDWDCRPCGRDGCDGTKISRCLVEIEAAEVFPALEDVLVKLLPEKAQ